MVFPYQIALTIQYPSGTALVSVNVIVRVESTNEYKTLATNSSGEVVFNLGSASDFPTGYTLGDIFTYYVIYKGYQASKSHTIATTDNYKYQETVVLTAVPSVPSIRYFTGQEFLDFFNLNIYEEDQENGIKMNRLIIAGEMAESDIDSDCNSIFDNNAGSYYSQTDYFDDVSEFRVFTPTKRPIYSITSFYYNTAREGSADSWSSTSLTENTEYTRSPDTDKIRVSPDNNAVPEDNRKRGWKLTYTYGRSSVPKDIKQLAMYETAINLGLSTVVKDKIGGHKVDSEDFKAWYNNYRNKVIGKYKYPSMLSS